MSNHLSGMLVTKTPLAIYPNSNVGHISLCKHNTNSYLILLRVGFFPATSVTRSAVRSYRTISPLPVNWRYIFCGTFRRLSPPRRYLALCPMEPDFPRKFVFRDCLADFRLDYIWNSRLFLFFSVMRQ